MITQRTRGLQSLMTLSQIWLFFFAFWIWFFCWISFMPSGPIPLRPYSVYCFWLLLGLFGEWVNRDKSRTTLYEFSLLKHAPVASRQTAFAFATLLIYLALSKDRFISRLFLSTLLPIEYFVLLWTNHVLPQIFVNQLFRGAREIKTLLVGAPASAEKLRFWLDRKLRFGFRVAGILTDKPGGENPDAYPVLGRIDSIAEAIGRHNITQVILLDYMQADDHYRGLIKTVEGLGARTMIMSNIEETLQCKVSVVEDDGYRFLTLHEDPLESPLNRGLKRSIDICFALPVILFVLPPLGLVVWLLQRFQSPGPLFHIQTRAGLQNREFKIVKFRTMHDGNEELGRQATANDSRIFPAGKWLRKLSLDEFPQFLNVIRGEMSVVGPRPHLVEHNQQFARVMAGYQLRTFVKPGITGLAQVRGFRGEANTIEDIQARLQSDMVYLENWSVPLDVAIILRTMWQLIQPPKTAR